MNITARHEFETIPAFTTIAGSSIGIQTPRETAIELLTTLDTIQSFMSTNKLWRELAQCSDTETDILFEIQEEIAEHIAYYGNIPEFCSVTLQDNEFIVLPYLDDDLEKFNECPDDFHGDHVLVVNDHGNVTCFQWDANDKSYKDIWAMV